MLTSFVELAELLALRTNPERALALLGLIPPSGLEAMRRARFSRTLRIAAGEFYDRAKAYRPTVIFGEPSWIVRLSEIAEIRGRWPLKFLFAGGENISELARRAVEEIWQAPLYLNYGQTESFGALGAEC